MSIQPKIISDAGTGMLPLKRQKYGAAGEVYLCPTHTGDSCSSCGGTGYRANCNHTSCHEYGCQSGCSRSAEDFQIQKLRESKVTP